MDEISYNSCDCCCFAGYKEEIDPDLEFELNHDCFMLNFEADLYPLHWLFGSGAGEKLYDSGTQTHFTSLASFNNTYLTSRDDGKFVDCIEFCGGNARTSQMLIRRRAKGTVRVGHNFDIVVGLDMLNRAEVNEFWTYMFQTQPLVVIMSPPCIGLAGFSDLKRIKKTQMVGTHHAMCPCP